MLYCIMPNDEIDELTCFCTYNDAKTKKKNLIKVNFSTSIVIWFLEVSSSQTNHLHSCSLFKCTSDIILNWSYKFRFMFIGRPFLNICFKESLFFNSILRIDKTLLAPLYDIVIDETINHINFKTKLTKFLISYIEVCR
jgi:hypothetical protein